MSEDLNIDVRADERAFICGKTGTGKTTLARVLLRNPDRLVVLDSKGSLTGWRLEEWTRQTRKKLAEGEPVRVRAALDPGQNPEVFWEEVLREVYYAANLFVYIDEAVHVAPSTKAPEWLTAVLTRGREFNIGLVASSQRPVWVPRWLVSEAEHFFVFRLLLPTDRDYMASIVGEELREPIPDKHGFYYRSTDMDSPVYIKRLPRGVARQGGDDVALALEVEEDDEEESDT